MSILNRESFPERGRPPERETRPEPHPMPEPPRTPPSDSSRFAVLPDKSAPTPPERCENVLAAGAVWEGKLRVDTSVRIDGRFSGAVESKGTVHVADGALVDAEIKAVFVVVAGKFNGHVECQQRVDLLSTSRVEAEITTRGLTVQDGAIVDGQIHMNRDAVVDRDRDRDRDRPTRNAATTVGAREAQAPA